MKRTVVEKFYIIFNLSAQKQYVGRTRNLDQRYAAHVSQLRAGKHENPELQSDWDRDGEEAFMWVDVILRAGEMSADLVEDLLIDTLDTMDPKRGYNRMTNRGWGPHARLRDLERKLIRSGRFRLIPEIHSDDPIKAEYLDSVWKGHDKKSRKRPEWDEPDEQSHTLEEQEQESEPAAGVGKCEEEKDELRDGEEGEGWEEERRVAEEGEEQL